MAELDLRFPGRMAAIGEVGRIALATAWIEEPVTNRRLQELTNRPGHDLTILLQDLCQQGLLNKSGRTTGTTYSVATGTEVGASDLSPLTKGPSSTSKVPSSTSKVPSSEAEMPSSDEPNDPITAVASSQRAAPALVRAAILALCRTGFRRPDDLATALNRGAKKLRVSYLAPMVREGLLELQYPEPTDPRQAYRARVAP